jgi:hypothetical protein
MTETRELHGQCLCGKVSLTTEVQPEIGVCHCSMCRRWGGGPFFATHGMSDLEFNGKEHITAYDSSEWGERAFCKHCGTHLYYRVKHNNEFIMTAGFFDDPSGFELNHQIFIDKKPDFYHFGNTTQNMTEAEFLAMFAPPEE